jgi:hypothetical protein
MAFSMPPIDVQRWLREQFPQLENEPHQITSPETDEYNCVAWAAGDTETWWWPSEDGYWPPELPLLETVENFIYAFQPLGYQPCDDGSFEAGYEKIAIYVGADGRVKHLARQLASGSWTSKLGQAWDIEHQTPQGIECSLYGQATQFLKRPFSGQP